mmetsp:Transcript_123055/g.359238  ORF Transcript_123055/g.359238 Transcript_123055/m.359238 type:complete len:450 (+) Transcript_123055:84-1433(+)
MGLNVGSQWLILVSFGVHAFCNQFMYMNFAVVPIIAADTFRVEPADANWFYSAALLASVPSFLCAMAFIDTWNWTTSLTGVLATVAAAWIRCLAVQRHSFALAIASSVALGPGTGVAFTGFAELPARLFPPGREQSFSSGVAVQSAFLGWALGGLFAPICISSQSTMLYFCLVQALAVSLCLPVFLYCDRGPADRGYEAGEASSHGAEKSIEVDEASSHGTESSQTSSGTSEDAVSPLEPARSILCNWRLLLQSLACSLLQAVGYTVPAVQEEVFDGEGYDRFQCAAAGFLFIMAGVAMGMLASGSASLSNPRQLVVALFWVGSMALCGLELLVRYFSEDLTALGHNGKYAVYLSLMISVGACSLGFLSVALPLVCALAWPVSEAYVGGAVELLGVGLAAPLTTFSTGHGFSVCAGTSLVSALLMSAGSWPGPSKDHSGHRVLTPEEKP